MAIITLFRQNTNSLRKVKISEESRDSSMFLSFDLNSKDKMINSAKRDFTIQSVEGLMERVEYLYKLDKEEPSDDYEEISEKSLKYFFSFFQRIPNLKCPGIGVTYEGNIYMEWSDSNLYKVGLEFLQDGKIAYVIFIKKENRREKFIGDRNIDQFLKIYKISGISQFLVKNNRSVGVENIENYEWETINEKRTHSTVLQPA